MSNSRHSQGLFTSCLWSWLSTHETSFASEPFLTQMLWWWFAVSLLHEEWCWKEKTADIEVTDKDVTDVAFVQSGYILSCSLSHDIRLVSDKSCDCGFFLFVARSSVQLLCQVSNFAECLLLLKFFAELCSREQTWKRWLLQFDKGREQVLLGSARSVQIDPWLLSSVRAGYLQIRHVSSTQHETEWIITFLKTSVIKAKKKKAKTKTKKQKKPQKMNEANKSFVRQTFEKMNPCHLQKTSFLVLQNVNISFQRKPQCTDIDRCETSCWRHHRSSRKQKRCRCEYQVRSHHSTNTSVHPFVRFYFASEKISKNDRFWKHFGNKFAPFVFWTKM